jgi:ribosome maturation factor RimP
MMSVVNRVRALVEPLLAEDGLELFDVEHVGGRVVVLVDRPGGVDLDALTRATHRISTAFDQVDPVPGGRYLLEVSSPGLERALRTPAHFGRHIGATVAVKTRPGVDGDRRCQGLLADADAEGFRVGERRFSYADVERVHTVFEWGPAPRPGKSAGRPGKPAPLRGKSAPRSGKSAPGRGESGGDADRDEPAAHDRAAKRPGMASNEPVSATDQTSNQKAAVS